MKRRTLSYFVALPALLIALSAQAYDPEENRKEAQAPNCAAMKDMDHSKMNMKDPVMQAMMQECMKAMHGDENGTHEGDADHSKHGEKVGVKQPTQHQHKK